MSLEEQPEKGEKPGPESVDGKIPGGIKAMLVLVGVFALGAVGYLAAAPDAVFTGVAQSNDDNGVVDGARLYTTHCAACHQASGGGIPGTFPPLAGSEWVQGRSELVAQLVLHGLHGRVTVKGAAYDNVMPGLGGQLSDAQIAAIVTHVRSSWGNTASAITSERVASERSRTAGRREAWNGQSDLEGIVRDLPPETAETEATDGAVNGVDANGNGVDANGNGVDANGNGVDANGNGVDANGNGVDANGNGG